MARKKAPTEKPPERIDDIKIKEGHPLFETIRQELTDPLNSYYQIARKHGCGINAVRRIAFTQGLRRDEPLPGEPSYATAQRASRTYSKDRRIDLLDTAFQKIEDLMAEVVEPGDLDKLISGLSKLIDKRRLEDGEATSRTESQSTVAKESLEAKLDDLAKRRAQKAANAQIEVKQKAKKKIAEAQA